MNHVINLAVQEFLKSIKALAPEDEENDMEEDEKAIDDDVTLPEGFALAMWKIRELTKVFPAYSHTSMISKSCFI